MSTSSSLALKALGVRGKGCPSTFETVLLPTLLAGFSAFWQ